MQKGLDGGGAYGFELEAKGQRPSFMFFWNSQERKKSVSTSSIHFRGSIFLS